MDMELANRNGEADKTGPEGNRNRTMGKRATKWPKRKYAVAKLEHGVTIIWNGQGRPTGRAGNSK